MKSLEKSIIVKLMSGVGLSAMLTTGLATGAFAQSIEDEIVVTSQRTEQSVQDVPIAVSAFGGEELDARQIESFTDIQFNIPNFSFSRSNFTGSSISLRGIGALAVGSSTEPSVSIHQNDVFLSATRLFETEFYDIERLEILRGPQGTLFGRNATGGVINVITAKADTSAIGGHIDVEYGNFASVKLKGALNVPIIPDYLATRIAGTIIQRDGFTENLVTGNDIDDRDIFSIRSSTRWTPTDNTTVDFVASYFFEDDARQRASNFTCNTDPTGIQGCLPGPAVQGGFGPDQRATFLANSSQEALGIVGALAGLPADAAGVFGLFSLADGPQLFQVEQPTDPRQVALDFEPTNRAEETVLTLNVQHDFENFTVKFNAGFGNSKIDNVQDFDGGVGPLLNTPAFLATGLPQGALFPGAPAGALGPGSPAIPPAPSIAVGGLPILANNFFGPGGTIPLSAFNFDQLTGSIDGNILGFFDNYQTANQSIGETDYHSFELIINSDFDGKFNFLAGANFLESNGFADFAVSTTGLDYFSVIAGTLGARGATFQGAIGAGLNNNPFIAGGAAAGAFAISDLQALAGADPQAFVQTVAGAISGVAAQQGLTVDGLPLAQAILDGAVTATNQVDGLAAFVPFFFNDTDDAFTESFSLFGEVYYDLTDTLKFTGGIRHNFDTKGVRDRGNLLDSFGQTVVPIGTSNLRPILDSDELTQGTPGAVNDFRVIEGEFDETTGRAVLQWTPADGVETYASYTRGFKPGGFNPQAPAGVASIPDIFGDETINAYEVGIKSILAGGALRANITGFYYDYGGLQVSNIISNTSFNENIDATVFGLEGEFVLKPTDNLIFNTTLSYLNTDIGEFSTLDTRDPLGGSTEDVLLADITNGQNCVLDLNGSPSFIGEGNPVRDAIITGLNGAGQPVIAGQFEALTGSPFTVCSALTDLVDGLQGFGLTGASVTQGNNVSVEGNELPGSSNFSASFGAQYTFNLGNGMKLTPRWDGYYQSSNFTSIFNTAEDRIDGYFISNAQIMLEPENASWFVRGFIQNLTDNDAVTGQFNAGQSVGNFNSQFLVEPRRYGIGLGFRF